MPHDSREPGPPRTRRLDAVALWVNASTGPRAYGAPEGPPNVDVRAHAAAAVSASMATSFERGAIIIGLQSA
jgi:hypothetical protein